MRAAFSIMLMQECCQFICQWENGLGGVPLRIKHLLHSSAVRYGEIFHSPSARENISPYLTLTRVISLIYLCLSIPLLMQGDMRLVSEMSEMESTNKGHRSTNRNMHDFRH